MNEVNVCFLNSHRLFLSPSKEMATTGAAQMKQLLTEYHLKGYDLAELADNELSNIVAFTLQAIGAVMAPDKLKSLEPTEIVERYGESTLKPTSPLVFRWRWKGDKHSLLGAWRYISPEHSGDFRGTEKLINDPTVEYQWLGDSAALREAQQAAFYNSLQLHEALTDIAELESSRGAVDIINERKRQITKEGRTAENDDAYTNGELAAAALSYTLLAKRQGQEIIKPYDGLPVWPLWMKEPIVLAEDFWPFRDYWARQAGERRDLVKAGALIVAEIDRIDRAAEKAAQEIITKPLEGGEIGWGLDDGGRMVLTAAKQESAKNPHNFTAGAMYLVEAIKALPDEWDSEEAISICERFKPEFFRELVVKLESGQSATPATTLVVSPPPLPVSEFKSEWHKGFQAGAGSMRAAYSENIK